ncbi:MAG: histidine phosphatase family protein [Ignavibacteria bacterium]|nr:histidine phosphatase family protein [Ignavibacteria bacterium]
MFTLFLIRHAKSSWDNFALSDKQRPLNSRGKKDASLMGQILSIKNEIASFIISSPAKRAFNTAKKIAKETGYHFKNIKKEKKLYLAEYNDFINIIKSFDDSHKNVFLISHNNGITNLANRISSTRIDNIPTCGIVKINFEINTWKEIKDNTGNIEYFIFPKMFKKSLIA